MNPRPLRLRLLFYKAGRRAMVRCRVREGLFALRIQDVHAVLMLSYGRPPYNARAYAEAGAVGDVCGGFPIIGNCPDIAAKMPFR